MAAAEEKTEVASSAPPASGGGSNKIVLILTAVNVVATLAMVAVLLVTFKKEQTAPRVEDIAAHPAGEHGEGEHGGGGGHGAEKKEGGHGEKSAHGKEGEKKKTADYGKMVSLDQFTVNLSTPGSVNPKFVRVNVSLEVPTEDAESEVTSKMPQVRNVIIDLFNSKRPADLSTAEGRDYLKEEIRNALNGFLVSGKVKGVFFTNFALSS